MIDLAQHDIGGRLVLVVDDDSRIRLYIRTILQSVGVQVLEAGDGLEALEVFHASKSRVDLVITDIRMPRMSGTDLASSLRSDAPAIPLILVSGEAAPADVVDRAVDAHQILKEHAARPDREVSDLGVAHLSGRQPDRLAGRAQRGVRKRLPKI